MTTCVYCKKEIDELGNYRDYDCPKLNNCDDFQDVCWNCRYYIYEGQEVPAP